MVLVTKSAGGAINFEEWNELVGLAEGATRLTGIGGSGKDGALTDLTTLYWPQPTTLTLAGVHTCKHLATLVASEGMTIGGTLTIPTSGNAELVAGDDYYMGMPLPAWMQAGSGKGHLESWSGDGGGGGSFGAGGPGDSGGTPGRGWGDNATAANLFTAATLWRILRHLRGGFGGRGDSTATIHPTLGHPGGCLFLLSEKKITISGTINGDGGDGGTDAGDIGGAGASTVIAISPEEVDGSGGVVNLRGGDSYTGDSGEAGGAGGGGFFAAIAPTVTMPTVNAGGGTGRNTANHGRDGDSHAETGWTADQIRALVHMAGLLGAAASGPARTLGSDA